MNVENVKKQGAYVIKRNDVRGTYTTNTKDMSDNKK